MPSIRHHHRFSLFCLHLNQSHDGWAVSLNPHSRPTLQRMSCQTYAISREQAIKRFQLILVKDLWRSRTMERAQRES